MGNENLEYTLIEESKVVYKYLIKIGASRETAEDIVQETIYKTLLNIDSVQADKLRAWLFKVAINAYYNEYNKNKKNNVLALDSLENDNLKVKSVEVDYGKKEQKRDVHYILNELKLSYKNLIILKYFLDLSYKDIADILEMKEQKVKVYLYRARNKFREKWEELNNG